MHKKLNIKFVVVTLFYLFLTSCAKPVTLQNEARDARLENPSFQIANEAKKFKLRYGVSDPYTKITDNKGVGDAELYGTRNMRVVLHGVMYRGGANNVFFAPPRPNTNPLPDVGIENLCREDFSTGVYLYAENYSTAPKSVSCKNTSQKDHTLQYKQHAADGGKEKILALIFSRIKGQLNGPVYTHCWNGWHSSGMISAIALKQFCDWTDEQADAYWVKNTDGHSAGFTILRNKIKAFQPISKYSITADEKAAICPAF
jgi:hypothetical protein